VLRLHFLSDNNFDCKGTYEGTSDGIWSGFEGYVYQNAMYVFVFANMEAPYYTTFLEEVDKQLQIVGAQSYNQTLPTNLLNW
jgi:hypothetical protein